MFSIPGPPAWVAVLICLVLGGGALLLEVLEQHRLGTYPATGRLIAMPLLGIAIGVAVSLALHQWGPVAVRSWGTMLMLGFVLALLWAIHDSRDDDEIDADLLIDVTLAILIGAVIGSRLMAVALNWSDFAGQPAEIFKVWEGGLSFHGGLIGGILGAALYISRREVSFFRIADFLAPSIAIGYAVTRVGCFLNGCCHGIPSDLPWAIGMPHAAGGLEVARHPAQLYAAVGSMIIFGLLLLVRRHLRRNGHLFLTYLIFYSAMRFVVEFFRRGASAEVFAPIPALTVAQFASICIALAAGLVMLATRQPSRERAE
ncbi:MAG: prolipoprotein diacylglyceryl transferase [Armatimonadota bacterium]